MNKKKVLGFTLVELMITIAIVGILASMAVPSFQKMIERNRLKEVAEGLKSDLMWMRTEAIKQSCDLKIDFDNAVWDYTIYQPDATCSCPADGSDCNIKVITGSQFQNVTMGTASFMPGGISVVAFDFRRGTTNNNGGVILNTANYQLKVIVSQTGRVRVCSSDNTKSVIGYDAC